MFNFSGRLANAAGSLSFYNIHINFSFSLCIVVCDPGFLCDTSEIYINVTPLVGISKPIADQGADLGVFPNPSTGSVLCSWTNDSTQFDKLEVSNMYGQRIRSFTLVPGQ